MKALILGAVLAVSVGATDTNTSPPRDASPEVCAALAAIAGSAWESRQRGVPLASAQLVYEARARDAGVTWHRRARISAAVVLGYAAPTVGHAERIAEANCLAGRL